MLRLPDHMKLVRDASVHPKIRALSVDLRAFGVEWGLAQSEWDLDGQLGKLAFDGAIDLWKKVDPPEPLPHEQVVIKGGYQPGPKEVKLSALQVENAWRGRFDGGARKGVASGGYLLFDETGAMRAGESLYFGTYTNNEAEAMACQALVQQLALSAPQGGTVIIEGDSKLVLSFLQRVAKPNKKSLVKLVAAIRKNLLLLPCHVIFRYIPREQNAACDWLAQ